MTPIGQAATTAVIHVLSVGAAGCCCLLSMSAPRLLIPPGACGFNRQCDSSALYDQAPMALCFVLGLAIFARLGHPQAASLTRCAALVSTAFWVLAVGLAWGWW